MLIWFVSVFSQAPVPDSLSGNAGWVGTGLLGGVLAWLLFIHLPKKDKQLEDIIKTRDQLTKDISLAQMEADKQNKKDFRESLQVVVNHCEHEVNVLVESLKGITDNLRKDVSSLGDVIGSLRNTVEFSDKTQLQNAILLRTLHERLGYRSESSTTKT